MGSDPSPLWIITRTRLARFPFRIRIERQGRAIFAVRAQSSWPGPGQQIFCLRDETPDQPDPGEEIERVPILGMDRVGRKLAVSLDRGMRKRAEFLSITKTRADGASYQQIFFRTESGIRAHRSRARVELLAKPDTDATILIDSAERYPWTFAEATTLRRKLAVGDYAVLHGHAIAAVVERKSFDNLLGDLGAIQALHQVCANLALAPRAALVVEAEYGDFLDPKRLAGRWPPSHIGRALAELHALHPRLPIVFAGNRKLANAWAAQFFQAAHRAAAVADGPQLMLLHERADSEYQGGVETVEDAVRRTAVAMGFAFSLKELRERRPEVAAARLRRVLDQLVAEGHLVAVGVGRGRRWERA